MVQLYFMMLPSKSDPKDWKLWLANDPKEDVPVLKNEGILIWKFWFLIIYI